MQKRITAFGGCPLLTGRRRGLCSALPLPVPREPWRRRRSAGIAPSTRPAMSLLRQVAEGDIAIVRVGLGVSLLASPWVCERRELRPVSPRRSVSRRSDRRDEVVSAAAFYWSRPSTAPPAGTHGHRHHGAQLVSRVPRRRLPGHHRPDLDVSMTIVDFTVSSWLLRCRQRSPRWRRDGATISPPQPYGPSRRPNPARPPSPTATGATRKAEPQILPQRLFARWTAEGSRSLPPSSELSVGRSHAVDRRKPSTGSEHQL